MASIQALSPLLYFSARKTFCASRMQRLIEFIGHHPYLAGGAVLAAAAVAFYEIRERIQAFAPLSATQARPLINQAALVTALPGREPSDARATLDPLHC